ncbi:MAG: hypothetical protein AAFU03_01530 [Bacteroidota bacterium]
MENFVFSSRAKMVTGGLAVLGIICLIWSYLIGGEDHHMRFWTNFLHNTTFFLGIAFMSAFTLAAFTTAYAGWYVQMKRVWESFSLWLLPALFLMGVLIVGLWMHSHHLYHWNDAEHVAHDEILTHKSAFLNKWWYTLATIIFVGGWYFFTSRMRQISVDEDRNGDRSYSHHKRYKVYAAIFLPIAGFTSAALIWQWIMSLDSHWYSTMFAWYASASWFVAMMALTIMVLIYLKSRGYFEGVNMEHFHDMGKYLFAISIFWTYLWFSQYMLIWYGNVGEETIYFRERLDNYRTLFYANLVINFVLPFFVLMRNDTKRKFGTLFFASVFVFFGHWLDFFLMIKPAALRTSIELTSNEGHDAHGEEAHSSLLEDEQTVHFMSYQADQHGNDHAEEQHDDGHNTTSHDQHGEEHASDDHDTSHDSDVHHDNGHDEHHSGDGAHHSESHGDGHGGGHHEFPDRYVAFKMGWMLPGFLEIGTFLGFLGAFLFFVFTRLEAAALEPKNDPYLEESQHHHT